MTQNTQSPALMQLEPTGHFINAAKRDGLNRRYTSWGPVF